MLVLCDFFKIFFACFVVFGLLSEVPPKTLANILNAIELLGIFPTTQNLLVALIEEDSGGHRPIPSGMLGETQSRP